MRILALDLSTHTGWAAYGGPSKPLMYDTFHIPIVGEYPYAHLDAAGEVAQRSVALVAEYTPDVVVIEETSRGYGHSQKVLEFIHCQTLLLLRERHAVKVVYLKTGEWRRAIGLGLTAEQRHQNKLARAAVKGRPCPTCATKRKRTCPLCAGKGALPMTAAEKAANKAAAGVKGVTNQKHLAVAWANETYKPPIPFLMKDNNTCEALALGQAFYILNP